MVPGSAVGPRHLRLVRAIGGAVRGDPVVRGIAEPASSRAGGTHMWHSEADSSMAVLFGQDS